ncbi:MAG: hypothetical protein IKI15_04715 [Lachnospiraceae bacterium]|nr:hypothetical protein [Lachnospiraceae bacterium]
MSDTIWFIIIGILFAALGVLFIWLGWQIRKKRKINLIISYHCDKVREENKPAYCSLAGIGVFLMGIGFAFSGITGFPGRWRRRSYDAAYIVRI